MSLNLRRKTFFVVPFYWFNQKQFFKQIQIFLRICPFTNLLRKKKSEYLGAPFWDSNFFE